MKIAVSRRLGIPLSTQIRDQIVTAIANGDLRPGDRLPTIRQLAEFLELNRNTVAQVYRVLEHEQYVVTRAGGGTAVADTAATTDAIRDRTLRDMVREALRTAEANGFSAREFAELAFYESAQWQALRQTTILVIDEYQGELDFLCRTIHQTLPDSTIHGMLVEEVAQATGHDSTEQLPDAHFALVPFYCLEQAQSLLADLDIPVFAAGIGPSVGALHRIAEETHNKNVAIVCTEPAGPRYMQRALEHAGISLPHTHHGYVGHPDLGAILEQSDVVVASHGSVDAVRQHCPDKPVITYSTLLTDESLGTIRSYTDRSRHPRSGAADLLMPPDNDATAP